MPDVGRWALIASLGVGVACDVSRVPIGSWGRTAGAGGSIPEPGGESGALPVAGASGASGKSGGGGSAGASAESGAGGAGASTAESGAGGDGGVGGAENPTYESCGDAGIVGPLNTSGNVDPPAVTVPYSSWNWSFPLDALEWDVVVETEPERDGYFWSHEFRFVGGVVGFVGLQGRGLYRATSDLIPVTTDMVVFWIGASPLEAELGDIPYPDSRALPITEKGIVWSTIHAIYDWEPCRRYRLRVARQSVAASGEVWYGAWIEDVESATQTHLGRFLVPAIWGRLDGTTSVWSNRIGYGELTSCLDPEPMSAFFSVPRGLTAAGDWVKPSSLAPRNDFDRVLRCPSSRFTTFTNGVRQEIGVR